MTTTVRFTRMEDGTFEEYQFLEHNFRVCYDALPAEAPNALKLLQNLDHRGAVAPGPVLDRDAGRQVMDVLDVHPVRGSIKVNFTDAEVWEMTETCALDVADRGGTTLEEVGAIMNLTRERIRQVEVRGLLKLKMGSPSPDELGAELLAQAAESAKQRN